MRCSIRMAAMLVLAAAGPTWAQEVPAALISYPDLILHGGKVLTVDKDFTVAEAIAVRDGKVLAVGASKDIRALAGPSTRVVDLTGRSVVPGFIGSDGDNAFAGGDLYKDTMINGRVLSKIRGSSVEQMLDEVRRLVATAEPGSPVYVRMADEFVGELSKLTVKDIDALAPKNPMLMSLSSSEGLVNSAMLQRAFDAGLARDHIGVVKDKDGRPTGQLYSIALGMVGWNLRDWPELTEETYRAQEKIFDEHLRVGVTTVTGHASGYTVTLMSQMFHDGRLRMRVRPDLDFARQNPLAAQFLRRTPNLVNFGLGDGMLRIVAAAVGPVDGASDDGGILTNDPKLRVHEVGGGPNGRNKWTGWSFTQKGWGDLTPGEKGQTEAGTLMLLRKHGWNIGGNHNMGSQAAAIVMETLAAADAQPGIKVPKMLGRNALDHNLIWDAKSIALARQYGDGLAFGLNSEIFSPRIVRGEDMLWAQYGERMGRVQPVKDLLAAGLNVHFEGASGDEPPLWQVERYVTRTAGVRPRRERGGGAPQNRVWGKDQAIDRKQALRMVTISAAKFMSEDHLLGSLEKGKFADMVVLDGDYLAVPDDGIDELDPVMTIVGGRIVYEAHKPGR